MAYTLTRALSLGADNAGKTLRAQLVDTAGANVGSPITTGFAARGPAGSYRWQGSLPDGFQGWIEIADTGTGSVLAVLPVNPRESEYADLKTSSRLAASTPLAELAYGPPANPTVEQAMMLLYMALRNRMETTASGVKFHNAAGGVITQAPLTDDGVTLSRGQLSSFSPQSLSGLRVWLRADLGLFQDSTLATPAGEGDPVGGWQDQSGAGNHAIQVTQAKRPTLKRDPLTGRSLVWADGTDDGLSFANGAIPAGERTFLVVVTCRNTSGHIFSTGRGGATLGSFELRRDHIIIYDDAASAFNHTHNFGSGWRVESHVFRTTGSEHRKNGGSLFTTTRSATLSTIQAGLFGRSLAANGSNMDFPLAGDIGEFIVYNRALTTTERERVEVYLKDRWGTP